MTTASDPVLDDLEQVDFFIEQELAEEAQALLDELENRHPGHILVADRREKLTFVKKGAAAQGATTAGAYRADSGGADPDAASGHGKHPLRRTSTPRLTWG